MVDVIMDFTDFYFELLCVVWTFIMDFMDYNYGLCGLLICSCIWFQMNVAYICMFVHVVLRLNIHLIFVYGWHKK